MRFQPHTIWMPMRRRAGIFALLGRSASASDVRYVDGAQPLGITLKEGET